MKIVYDMVIDFLTKEEAGKLVFLYKRIKSVEIQVLSPAQGSDSRCLLKTVFHAKVVLSFLESETASEYAGFAIGMSSGMRRDHITKNPLTSLFFGSLTGLLCAVGAGVVRELFPARARLIIPLVATFYTANQLRRLFFTPQDKGL
jgi:hypothetical protein